MSNNNIKHEASKILKSNNHYDVLGLAQKATKKEIKNAYKEMALKYHPDKTQLSQAKDVFNKVATAYNVLSNQNEREGYDESLSKSKPKTTMNFSKQQKPKSNYSSNTNIRKQQFQQFKYSQAYDQARKAYKQESKQSKLKKEQQKEQERRKAEEAFKKQYANGNSARQNKNRYRNSQARKKQGSFTTSLIALILFLIVWYIFPSFQTEPSFSWLSTPVYNIKLKTTRLKVTYFVKSDFNKEEIAPEEKIQSIFIKKLERQCQLALNSKKKLQILANTGNPLQRFKFIQSAKQIELKPCKKIVKLLKKHPQIKLTIFKDNINI